MRDHLKTPGTPINNPMGIKHGSQVLGAKRSIILPETVGVDQEDSFSTAPLNNGKAVYVPPKIAILTKTPVNPNRLQLQKPPQTLDNIPPHSENSTKLNLKRFTNLI
jgi:hypothetical protein